MGKCVAFARIKDQVLTMTASIPEGRVSTYRSLGEHIDVMPRHVAYILTTLEEAEKAVVPWYRVVAEAGVLSAPSSGRVQTQRELLKQEGVEFADDRKLANFAKVFVAAADLDSGIAKQFRSVGEAVEE
ncbi:MAG TPA: MGMT family protein [Trichocoleus sp.]